MNETYLDVDDSEIYNITSISIGEVSGDFSPEWLSCQFIDTVIKGINGLVSEWEQAKIKANKYISNNNDVSNQPEPNLPQENNQTLSNYELDMLYDSGLLTLDELNQIKNNNENENIGDDKQQDKNNPWSETSVEGSIGENPRIKAEREAQDRARNVEIDIL